jgi:hypothetical protein
MLRSSRSLIPVLAAIVCLWPAQGSAQTEPSPYLSSVVESADHVRAAFVAAGYDVGQPDSWNWTSPPVTTFQVRDAGQDRVLMVFVYSSTTAADAARLEAEAHEQALNGGIPMLSDSGPHLIVGYGPSLWDGSVALVQTTQSELARAYQSQVDRDAAQHLDVHNADAGHSTAPPVDADFQEVLQSSLVNL